MLVGRQCGGGSDPSEGGPTTFRTTLNGVLIAEVTTFNNNCEGPDTSCQDFTPAESADYGTAGFPGYVTGGTNVFGVSIVSGPLIHLAHVRLIFTYQAAGTFTFDLDQTLAFLDPDAAKLLLHEYRGGRIPSKFQSVAPIPTPGGAQRPQMTITGAVGGGAGRSGDIYFKLLDVPDAADYVRLNGDAHANDNKDAAAVIMLPDGTSRTNVRGVLHTSWDATTQHATIILEGAEHDAGDNYQIEASFDSSFACESDPSNPCAQSAVITTWKRIYLESHQMFRSGAFVAEAASAGATEVAVTDRSPFREGQQVTFLHGILIGATGAARSMWEESATIASPTSTDKRPGIYRRGFRGPWIIRLTNKLNYAYSAQVGSIPFTGDGIGVDAAGFFRADTSLLQNFYADSFVDPVEVTPAMWKVPFADFSTVTRLDSAELYFSNRYRDNQSGSGAAPNHMLIIAATQEPLTSACATSLGDTRVGGGVNSTFLWQQRIEQGSVSPLGGPGPCAGKRLRIFNENAALVAPQVLAHETVHQWRANHGPAPYHNDSTGHCTADSYRVPGDLCLMNRDYPPPASSPQVPNARIYLHYRDPGPDSEYMWIRGRQEPIPQP